MDEAALCLGMAGYLACAAKMPECLQITAKRECCITVLFPLVPSDSLSCVSASLYCWLMLVFVCMCVSLDIWPSVSSQFPQCSGRDAD